MSYNAMALLALAGAAVATPLAAQTATPASVTVAAEPTLDEVRALTARYQDVAAAVADGYVRDPSNTCESADMMGLPRATGVMGIHYAHMERLGVTAPPNPRVDGTSTHTDFRRPGVLIYEPQADGSLKLVAVENLVFIKAWEAAGHTAPPTFLGHPFNRMVDDPKTELDEAHHFAPHYDLHVWLYRENPAGMFAQFNPAATCEHHKGSAGHH